MTTHLPYLFAGIDADGYAAFSDPALGIDATSEEIPSIPGETEEMTECDYCGDEITQEEYDAADGICCSCDEKTFVCAGCSDRADNGDVDPKRKTLCTGCGEAKDEEIAQERLDTAKDMLRDLTESIIDLDNLDVLRKAAASLKKLQPK